MPYALLSDTFATDSTWEMLSGRNGDLADRLQAAYARLLTEASHQKNDGYLMAGAALAICRGRQRVLDLLTTAVLDRPAWLHRQGDDCACLGDAWVQGYAYRIHAFLKRNPSRVEYERNRAQKADLRDPRLKSLVYARDGGCCRYCRSGPLSPKAGRSRDRRKVLQYDHLDPDRPADPDGAGLVVACGACNEHKGHRTPGEADMVLLAEPTDRERSAWMERGLFVFDRPELPLNQPINHRPITDETATDQCSVADRNSEPTTVPISDDDADPIAVPIGAVRLHPADQQQEQTPAWSGKGAGLGRVAAPVGEPPSPAPPNPQPARPASAPDIYTRRSRASPQPHEGWPPGSVPATRRPPPEGGDPWT